MIMPLMTVHWTLACTNSVAAGSPARLGLKFSMCLLISLPIAIAS